jgi:TPP-dependent pyruvate/acetoin dehydrogenase alpha subunit
MFDAELYRDRAEVDEWKKRDPLFVLRRHTGIGDSDFASLDAEVLSEIGAAVAFAESGTWEPVDQLTRDVYTSPQEVNRERLAS